MEGQGWRAAQQGSPNRSPTRSAAPSGYDVQSTYMPPQDPHSRDNSNPFGLYDLDDGNSSPFPEAQNPFVGSVAGAPGLHSGGTAGIRVAPAAATGDTTLVFHDSDFPSHNAQGKMGPGAATEVPKVQPYGGAASALIGRVLAGAGGGDPPPGSNKAPGFFSIKRYSGYFNVDTEDVAVRMLDSVIGCFRPNFLEKIGEQGDLYGPFWIATTLVALSGVIGNHEITKVGASAGLFYGYVGVIGVLLWGAFKWIFKANVGLTQIWCMYGYALSIYIPVALLCVIRIEVLRWVLIGVSTLTSGLFLMLNFRAPIFEHAGAKALPVWLGMGGLHLGLGLALKLYFFRYKKASLI